MHKQNKQYCQAFGSFKPTLISSHKLWLPKSCKANNIVRLCHWLPGGGLLEACQLGRALTAEKDPVGQEQLFQTSSHWIKRQKESKTVWWQEGKAMGNLRQWWKQTLEEPQNTAHTPHLHQGASKENYNNTAFSFLINEDCYLAGGRAKL